ncbi:hypothetical protein ACIP8I_02285 [Pseudomonas sp. NPDC088414]|uniref:hypothetical protein n=1 Tax=Pseudomonas sp. NPDC088414 TaxID=3364454 RepID=UPI0037F9C294
MHNSDMLPDLLSKIYKNQCALEVAVSVLADFAEKTGNTDVADNVRGSLSIIDTNEELIKMTLAVLMSPE